MMIVCSLLGTEWVASIAMARAGLAGGDGLAGYISKLHSYDDDDDDDDNNDDDNNDDDNNDDDN